MRYLGDNKPHHMYKVCIAGTKKPMDELTPKEYRKWVLGVNEPQLVIRKASKKIVSK